MRESPAAATDRRTRERLRIYPELAAFAAAIEPAVTAADPEEFWSCEQAFAELLASPFLRRLVKVELDRVATDPAYVPTPGVSPYEFTVAATDAYTLCVELFEPGVTLSRKLYSTTSHCLVAAAAFPGAGGPAYDWYEQRRPDPNEVFDRSRALTPCGRRAFACGEVFRVRAGVDIARIVDASRPMVLLFFGSRNFLRLRWEYSDTLLPLRAMAADPAASRLEYTARMLAELGDDSSAGPLTNLLGHPDHFVRWAGIRAVMRLDHRQGLRLLEEAADDPHPHVRNAARAAREKLAGESRTAKGTLP